MRFAFLTLSLVLITVGTIDLHGRRYVSAHDLRKTIIVHDTIYVDSARLAPKERTVEEILASLPDADPSPISMALFAAPKVLRGYKHLHTPQFEGNINDVWDNLEPYRPEPDSLTLESELPLEITTVADVADSIEAIDTIAIPQRYNPFAGPKMPDWLLRHKSLTRIRENAEYLMMIHDPYTIEYAFWQLPEPPRLPNEDRTFAGYIRSQWLPRPENKIMGGLMETEKIDWIHDINGGIQFSQAYISPNWYQGGNNSLSLLIDLLWHVQLNTIVHPNLLFDNVISYKLGITSSPQDEYHKYTISEDLFQWNFKAGVKAFDKWFYSVTTQFKTQMLNNFAANSMERTAAFLSPGDFNAGLGMTYAYVSKSKNFKLNASIAPISYNLKTCINSHIDPAQFNIPAGRKTVSEFGSNSEVTLNWTICKNVNYSSRLFLFTDYSYFQGDWENTLSFKFNRFLSTQIYCHLRYDSSSDLSIGRWHHWMLKEILSFGFAYTFSTKA